MRGNEARAGVGIGPVQGFFDFVKSLGAARMAAMAAVTLALIGFFSFLMIRTSRSTWSTACSKWKRCRRK